MTAHGKLGPTIRRRPRSTISCSALRGNRAPVVAGLRGHLQEPGAVWPHRRHQAPPRPGRDGVGGQAWPASRIDRMRKEKTRKAHHSERLKNVPSHTMAKVRGLLDRRDLRVHHTPGQSFTDTAIHTPGQSFTPRASQRKPSVTDTTLRYSDGRASQRSFSTAHPLRSENSPSNHSALNMQNCGHRITFFFLITLLEKDGRKNLCVRSC